MCVECSSCAKHRKCIDVGIRNPRLFKSAAKDLKRVCMLMSVVCASCIALDGSAGCSTSADNLVVFANL